MNLSTVAQLKNLEVASMVVVDDKTLHALQQVLLLILDDITSFCEEEGICYVLGGGSVLGAIRHEGFIPWDDDIDINMPRADYDRFIELFPQRFGNKYSIQAPELTPNVGTSISRVRLRGTTLRMHDDCAVEECGIFIDIFPIENTYNNPLLRKAHGLACMAGGLMYSCRRFWRDRAFYERFGKGNRGFLRTVRTKAALGLPLSVLSMSRWTRIVVGLYTLCKDQRSTYVTVPSGRNHFFGELYPRDAIARTRFAPFEGRKVRVPQDAEAYLTNMYGDWHRVPPPEERERHAYLELDLGEYALQGDSDQKQMC